MNCSIEKAAGPTRMAGPVPHRVRPVGRSRRLSGAT
jgi:hypothetical protein